MSAEIVPSNTSPIAEAVERAHAILSASGAKKWLNCTPSARLEETFTDEGSEFASEGTKCHELLEIAARYEFHGIKADAYPVTTLVSEDPATGKQVWSTEWVDLHTEEGRRKAGFNGDMDDAVKVVLAEIRKVTSVLDAAKEPYVILVELRLNYSAWAPEGFGTGDIVIVSQKKIWVFDLKYGKGVEVSSIDNEQMKLYALGAWAEFSFEYDGIEEVEVCIVQPRMNNVSPWCVSLADLLAWGENHVKPRAALAWAGEGEFNPGPWCKEGFCKARFNCRARAEANLAAAGTLPDKRLLSPLEIDALLPKLDDIEAWAKDVSGFALRSAVDDGVRYPHYKLVEGRSNRYIKDPKLAAVRLVANGVKQEDLFNTTEPQLKGITDLERICGGKKKFTLLLGDIIGKPPGKPTLVPVDDPRPEWKAKASADEDFDDE